MLFPVFGGEMATAKIQTVKGFRVEICRWWIILGNCLASNILLFLCYISRNDSKKCKYLKLFIICAFVFVLVGTLYRCVFAMTAYIYNKLYNLQVLKAKLISEQLFFAFIAVASLAAVAFAGLSVYLFFVTITGKIMFLVYSIRYSHNELSDNKKE